MERYLLFDSGCSLCTSLARRVEEAADGKLTARSLRDPEVRSILDDAKPGWRWEPMLLEVDGDRRQVYAGIGMRVRLVQVLGPRRALRLAQIVQSATVFQPDRRGALRQMIGVLTGIMFAGQAAKSLAASPKPNGAPTNVYLPLVASDAQIVSTVGPWRIPSAVGAAASELGVLTYEVATQSAQSILVRFTQKGRTQDAYIRFERLDTGLSMELDRDNDKVAIQWHLRSGELFLSSSQGDYIHFTLDREKHQFLADNDYQRQLVSKYKEAIALIGAIGHDFGPVFSSGPNALCEKCRSSISTNEQKSKANSICCDYSNSVSGHSWGWTRSAACFYAQNQANVKCWNSLCIGCCSMTPCDCACVPDTDFICWCIVSGAPCEQCPW